MDVKSLALSTAGGLFWRFGESGLVSYPRLHVSRSALHRSVCMMINFREMVMGMPGIPGGFWASHGVEINAGFESNLG